MRVLLALAILPLAACVEQGVQSGQSGPGLSKLNETVAPVTATPAQSADQAAMNAFAKSLLNSIQTRSIAEQVEYCGYILRAPDGGFTATPPNRGNFDSCENDYSGLNQILASYHTHGSYGREYDNEVPSTVDMEGDLGMGVDGYISTPGGRFWLIDHESRSANMLCGRSCMIDDPGYVVTDDSTIRTQYSLGTLRQREQSL